MRDEDQRSYNVRDAVDVQAAWAPPIDEYVSDSTVGSDDEAPATSRRAPSKVVAPRRTRQTTGKISASRAATQVVEVKKKKRMWTWSAVSADMTTISSDVETIDVDDEEGDAESLKVAATPSAGTPRRAASPEKQAVETPCQASKTQEHPRSSIDLMGDLGWHKRAKKAPPKPCKPDLRSATK
jgi:hypothetical protein